MDACGMGEADGAQEETDFWNMGVPEDCYIDNVNISSEILFNFFFFYIFFVSWIPVECGNVLFRIGIIPIYMEPADLPGVAREVAKD